MIILFPITFHYIAHNIEIVEMIWCFKKWKKKRF